MVKTVKKKTAVECKTELDNKSINDWRNNVTIILAQQTEILNALRQDFKDHEIREDNYQEKITKFILETSTESAVAKVAVVDIKAEFIQLAKLHSETAKIVNSINNKVWLALGAVMVYGPVISFLAVELYRHLTTGH